MKISKTYWVLIIFIVGCSLSTKETLKQVQYNVFYDTPLAPVQLQKVSTKYRYIPLETNDNSLLEDTTDPIMYKNNRFYIDNQLCIFMFDYNGKYLKTFDRHGPGEYGLYHRSIVNDKGDIVLLTGSSRNIYYYTSEGDFVSKISLDSLCTDGMVFLNDTLLLLQEIEQKNGYKYHVLNLSNSQVQNTFTP